MDGVAALGYTPRGVGAVMWGGDREGRWTSLKLRISMRQKAILIWEEVMPTLVGFGTFAAVITLREGTRPAPLQEPEHKLEALRSFG